MEIKKEICKTLTTIKENIQESDLTGFFVLFVLCFGIGTGIEMSEYLYLIPVTGISFVCFVLGFIFLIPIFVQDKHEP